MQRRGQPCLQQDLDERCNTSDRIIAVFVVAVNVTLLMSRWTWCNTSDRIIAVFVVTINVSTEGSHTCNMYRLASSFY